MAVRVDDRLAGLDWELLTLRLVKYVRSRRRTDSILAKGFTLDDVVAESFERFLKGSRQWDPTTCPDAFVYLRGVARSILSELHESPERTKRVPGDPPDTAGSSEPGSEVPTAERELMFGAELAREQELEGRILAAVEDDPVLTDMVLAQLDGDHVPIRELAERLGHSRGELYNAQKKLKRRLEPILGLSRKETS